MNGVDYVGVVAVADEAVKLPHGVHALEADTEVVVRARRELPLPALRLAVQLGVVARPHQIVSHLPVGRAQAAVVLAVQPAVTALTDPVDRVPGNIKGRERVTSRVTLHTRYSSSS